MTEVKSDESTLGALAAELQHCFKRCQSLGIGVAVLTGFEPVTSRVEVEVTFIYDTQLIFQLIIVDGELRIISQ